MRLIDCCLLLYDDWSSLGNLVPFVDDFDSDSSSRCRLHANSESLSLVISENNIYPKYTFKHEPQILSNYSNNNDNCF